MERKEEVTEMEEMREWEEGMLLERDEQKGESKGKMRKKKREGRMR